MIDAVKKIQFHEELRHALELLSVYIKTNNWSEIIPIDNDSRDYSNNIIEIQEILKKSIFCKEDCS
ncbi:MAG: hypothetical protein C0433_13240 [Cyclobacterium sp.]|nr:hypothetical protein [Cyclobacterium sp.]